VPTVIRVPSDHPDVSRLVDALLTEMAERYDDDPDTIARTDPDAAWVLLVDDDGTANGCGALQRLSRSKPDAAADHGEIKRVYVAPAARGRGMSRQLMAALVDLARERGLSWLQLETGDVQPEAIGLYESSGWTRVASYGQYEDDPRSVCFGLDVSAQSGEPVRG
jgi:GNAT superfamily N-acetyltransferase